MLTIITIAAMAAALAIGLAANHYRRRRAPQAADEEAAPISDLISPLETLAVLLVAFVIVVAAESFGSAGQAVGAEAHRVDQLYEVADYAPEPQRERIQADAVCYARAILAYEWPQMDKDGRKSPEVSVWSSDFRRPFKELARTDADILALLVDADDQRSVARQTRLSEAAPAIPRIVYWFMVVALAATIGAFAFGLPAKRSPSHMVLLFVLAALFTGSLLLIADIDRPFSGQIRIDSTAMEDTVGDIGEDFTEDHPGRPLPCDSRGARTPDDAEAPGR
ncbi:bestrophin-like domain [Streptomyces gardneri]|uniref:bestrophin-like domain n=1 Tax=Streptomyces gardneri TaxID=66892 RepID=UPI0036A49343